MTRQASGEAYGHLRTVFNLGTTAGLSDAQLLERFLARRDEAGDAAFATLVQRHGPLVMGVCRRVTPDRHTAEDACQATFLVLAHKARSIAPRDRLANWLYGVALRCAQKARSQVLRQRARETPVMPSVGAAKSDDPAPDDELLAILDEELSQLPERLRSAVVLCELEGLTRAAAALRLGIPEGTLSSRLASARRRLRERLVRRGVTLSVPALTLALARDVKAVALPVRLIESTVQAASLIAAGANPSPVATASVVALIRGVLKSMLISNLKTIAAVLTAATGLAAGAAVFACQDLVPGQPPGADPKSIPPGATSPETLAAPAPGTGGPLDPLPARYGNTAPGQPTDGRADEYLADIVRLAREAAECQRRDDIEGAIQSLGLLQRTAEHWSRNVSASGRGGRRAGNASRSPYDSEPRKKGPSPATSQPPGPVTTPTNLMRPGGPPLAGDKAGSNSGTAGRPAPGATNRFQPSLRTGPPQSEDRLDELERKVNRILEMLERSGTDRQESSQGFGKR